MSDLKPCPFCGGEARLLDARPNHPAFVYCIDCDVSTSGMARRPLRRDNAEAIAAWNRRTPAQSGTGGE